MIKGLYCVRDVKAGNYWPPIAHVNDEVAKREFGMLCHTPDVAYLANDLQLYKVGTFNDQTASIDVCNEFICNCVDVMPVITNVVKDNVVQFPQDGDVNE